MSETELTFAERQAAVLARIDRIEREQLEYDDRVEDEYRDRYPGRLETLDALRDLIGMMTEPDGVRSAALLGPSHSALVLETIEKRLAEMR
ncbi:hypothetical protein PXH69_24520 [Rhodococcus qingshengii]|uniref:Uncharacterized protein n=1 Tax=Rhodococcus qingshengii TaxID=334542 RepID=A0AAW6LRP5_RHOSG|nr:hypothetical protein [Rhodococcus qingshengii]MDE8648136.1 hypothetical protein [Rhodococcus qingshengii]